MNNPQGLTPMDQMEEGELVNLKLGDHDRYEVIRVVGGWIYTRIMCKKTAIIGNKAEGEPIHMTSTFVAEIPKQ